jgi:hypothetical protein
MAEKIIIADIDINYDQAVKDSQALKGEVGLLTAQLKKAKEETGETSAETVQYEIALKSAKAELGQQSKHLSDVTTAQTANQGSLKQQKAQLAIVAKKWNELSAEERLNTDAGKALAAQKLKLTEGLKNEEVATGQAGRNVGFYGEQVTSTIPALGKATNAAKMFGVGMKVALGPIVLVIAAMAALTAHFKRSEKGQNQLIKITKVFELVLGNILDVVASVGEMIFDAFSKPKESIDKLGKLIKQNIANRFEGLMELIPKLGKAIQKLFAGEFAEAGKIATDAVAKIALGVEDFSDKVVESFEKASNAIKEFSEELSNEIDIAIMLADRQAVIDKQVRQSLVLTAKERLQLAKIKNKIEEKEAVSAEQRLKAVEEQNAILDKQALRVLAIANERLKLKEIENSLTLSTTEDLNEEATLRAAVFEAETAIEALRTEAITKRLGIEAEIAAATFKISQEKLKILDQELLAWVKQNEDRISTQEEFNNRLLEQQLEFASIKLEAGLINQQEYNDALTEAQVLYDENESARKLEVAQLDMANLDALRAENRFAELERMEESLAREYDVKIAQANKIGADTTAIEAKYAQDKNKIDDLRYDYVVSAATSTLQAVITLFGEQTAAGKAAAVALATIETLQSAVSSFKAMASIPYVGPILGAIAASAAIVAGYATIDQILAVDTDPTSTSAPAKTNTYAGVGNAVSSTNTQSAIQNVNTAIGQGIVARDTATIDISEPIRVTTVVVDQVTEAQDVQNEKVDIATIG